VRRDESSPIVTAKGAKRTDIERTHDIQPSGVAVGGAPPLTSAAALKLAVKLALDEGDLDGAAALLDVARKLKPRPVVDLRAVRRRDDDEGTG
jgi:hypothetical protein